ncbi:MAG: ABC transporter ATP-binding protein, partial [Gammaproteobacteria bacterium]
PLRDALERIERELDAHRERLTEIERTLADPALYASGDAERLAALAKEQAEIKRRIEDVETRWLEAAEALEAARSGAAPVARSR